jgi:hypothetical protein
VSPCRASPRLRRILSGAWDLDFIRKARASEEKSFRRMVDAFLRSLRELILFNRAYGCPMPR